jgi:hypothetical protein
MELLKVFKKVETTFEISGKLSRQAVTGMT